MNTITSKWEEFVKDLPPDVPEGIMESLKQTFFSGAFAYMELEHHIDNDSSISGDASVAIMQGIEEELLSFLGIEVVTQG